MENAIFSHSSFHLFSMGFYCFLCFYSCFYQIFSLYQTCVLPAVIIKNTTRELLQHNSEKYKQSCWKAIEMRYTILALRACLKIVHTHHFEGKKTPALEPVKGGTLIPNLSRTLSTLKLPHDRLIVLLMIACPFRRNANKSGRQCMGWLHSVTIPTIFKWATGSRRLFLHQTKL